MKLYLTNEYGLTPDEVGFLYVLESEWFATPREKFNYIEAYGKALKRYPVETSKNLYDYFKWIKKPQYKESLINPFKLSEFVKATSADSIGAVRLRDFDDVTMFEGNTYRLTQPVDHLAGQPYYLKLIQDRLYLKYEQIIGSRYIAKVENDLLK